MVIAMASGMEIFCHMRSHSQSQSSRICVRREVQQMSHNRFYRQRCHGEGTTSCYTNILSHEIPRPKSKLPYTKVGKRVMATSITNDAMERKAHRGSSRLPFPLHKSYTDDRLRLSFVHPSDGANELCGVSNGKNDVKNHWKGDHDQKDIESMENVKSSNGNAREGCRTSGCSGRSIENSALVGI
uniref:Uncharacterized protein n=1 Tax=Leersia perrieri TaxID=77586 RepID=A0A0D9XZX6_9ORYZ